MILLLAMFRPSYQSRTRTFRNVRCLNLLHPVGAAFGTIYLRQGNAEMTLYQRNIRDFLAQLL
jgi:hypothetical protein